LCGHERTKRKGSPVVDAINPDLRSFRDHERSGD
jgi:hypothetical protein